MYIYSSTALKYSLLHFTLLIQYSAAGGDVSEAFRGTVPGPPARLCGLFGGLQDGILSHNYKIVSHNYDLQDRASIAGHFKLPTHHVL